MKQQPWQQDYFFQYPRNTLATSEGNVDMPILYFDNSVMMAGFRVDYAQAQALVADQGMEAVRFIGGKALVVMAFYEYRATTIGDYNEVGIGIAVVPAGTKIPSRPLLSLFSALDQAPIGFCIIDLPVTTAAACAAGREIWGYPKFVTPIEFSLKETEFNGCVKDPANGNDLLRLAGKAGCGVRSPLLDLVLYSRHQGRLLRTLVNTRGGAQACLPGSLSVTIGEDSQHPMAQRLRALGLAHAKPAFVFHSHALQLRLNPGAAMP